MKGVGEGEVWVGREEEEPPQIKTQGHKLALDGPDHITRPKVQDSGQG